MGWAYSPLLTATPTPAGATYTLNADVGLFALAGQQSNLLRLLKLNAGFGVFALAGQQVDARRSLRLDAVFGSLMLSGQGIVFQGEEPSYSIGASCGSITFTLGGVSVRRITPDIVLVRRPLE